MCTLLWYVTFCQEQAEIAAYIESVLESFRAKVDAAKRGGGGPSSSSCMMVALNQEGNTSAMQVPSDVSKGARGRKPIPSKI